MSKPSLSFNIIASFFASFLLLIGYYFHNDLHPNIAANTLFCIGLILLNYILVLNFWHWDIWDKKKKKCALFSFFVIVGIGITLLLFNFITIWNDNGV